MTLNYRKPDGYSEPVNFNPQDSAIYRMWQRHHAEGVPPPYTNTWEGKRYQDGADVRDRVNRFREKMGEEKVDPYGEAAWRHSRGRNGYFHGRFGFDSFLRGTETYEKEFTAPPDMEHAGNY